MKRILLCKRLLMLTLTMVILLSVSGCAGINAVKEFLDGEINSGDEISVSPIQTPTVPSSADNNDEPSGNGDNPTADSVGKPNDSPASDGGIMFGSATTKSAREFAEPTDEHWYLWELTQAFLRRDEEYIESQYDSRTEELLNKPDSNTNFEYTWKRMMREKAFGQWGEIQYVGFAGKDDEIESFTGSAYLYVAFENGSALEFSFCSFKDTVQVAIFYVRESDAEDFEKYATTIATEFPVDPPK